MGRIVTIVILLYFSVYSLAQVSQPLVIRTIGFAPYGISTPQLGGIYYETANILAQEAGFTPNNNIAPYARIIEELKAGRADLTIMFKYDELDDYVIYIAPLAPLKTVVIGLNGTEFKNYDQLKHKTIAYLRGAHFSDTIDNDPAIIKYKTADFLQGVRMLMAGRVDAIIGPIDPILSAAAQMNKNIDLFGTPLIVAERTPWIQLSIQSKHIGEQNRLKAAYIKIKQQGVIEALRNKYVNLRPVQ